MSDTPTPPTTRDAELDLAVCDAATPGPWERDVATLCDDDSFKGPNGESVIASVWHDGRWLLVMEADAKFITVARAALPYWIRDAVAQHQRADDLERRLAEVERDKVELMDSVRCHETMRAVLRERAADAISNSRSAQQQLDKQSAFIQGLHQRLAEVELERDSALAEIHNCLKCGRSCKQCDCYDAELEAAKADNVRLAERVRALEQERDEAKRLLLAPDEMDDVTLIQGIESLDIRFDQRGEWQLQAEKERDDLKERVRVLEEALDSSVTKDTDDLMDDTGFRKAMSDDAKAMEEGT